MDNAITQFEYAPTGTQVRTVEIDGEPWFVARDVCAILGIRNSRDALNRVPDTQKGLHPIQTPGGTQRLSIVSEAGLYRLVMRSDKPEAEPFIAWVTEEVLPTSRNQQSWIKTGGAYLTLEEAEEILFDPDLIIGLAQQVIDLKAKEAQLTSERDEAIQRADEAERTKAQIGSRREASVCHGNCRCCRAGRN